MRTSQRLNAPKCPFWPCQTHDLDIFRIAWQLVNQTVGQSGHCFTNCILSFYSLNSVICRRRENTPNYFIYRGGDAAPSSSTSSSRSGCSRSSLLLIECMITIGADNEKWNCSLFEIDNRNFLIDFITFYWCACVVYSC